MPNPTHIIDKHESAKKGRKHTLQGNSRENKHKTPNKAKKIGRRRLRWCIECCRLFKAGDEDPARGAGIKVEDTPRPTHRRDPVPHPAGGRPAQLQQEGGGDRKPLGRMSAVSPAHNPAVAIQLTKPPQGASTRRLNA